MAEMAEGAIETVVVPLDGSDLAEAALPVGRAIAARAGAALRLVRVLDLGRTAEAQRQAEQALWESARRADVEARLKVRVGDAAEEILREAAALPAPLVVMTTHGRSGLGRWLIGSVADRVVRGGTAPVLLLRSGVSLDGETGTRRLLVPLDGSALAEDALPIAQALARAFGAELHLARVAETTRLFMLTGTTDAPVPDNVMEELVAGLEDDASAYLAGVIERLASAGVAVRAAVLSGVPVDALLTYVDRHAIELVVLATHGRGGFNRLVLGSVAERVLLQGHTPILVVPPVRSGEVGTPTDGVEAAGRTVS
ncbi:MAG TPA: universal stress protein [Thermomicrobiaceae bacterium]|nr:universal stress protein [Thermomicrobiaceae bacterium]